MLTLSRDSRIFKRHIDQIDRVRRQEQIVGKSCQDCAVKTSGKQNGHPHVIGCTCVRRHRHV